MNSFIDGHIRRNPAIRQLAGDCRKEGTDFKTVILQCGDLAFYWPHTSHVGVIDNEIDFLPTGRCPIYWCGGNHEDWDQLDRLFPAESAAARRNIAQVDDGIYFCRFGATLKLGNINILFAGGAESVDKEYRLKKMREEKWHKIWWEQESITQEDLERLENIKEADWVISHTAPAGFDLAPWLAGNGWSETVLDETSREALETVRERFRPKLWFFGHFHRYMDGMTDGCRWEGLADVASQEKSWTVITLD